MKELHFQAEITPILQLDQIWQLSILLYDTVKINKLIG
jgi:hypothetical protein